MGGEESSLVLWCERELQSTVAFYSSAVLGKENRGLNWIVQEAYGRSAAGGDGKGGLAAAGRAMNRAVLNILKATWRANWPVSILLFTHIFYKSKLVTSLLHTSYHIFFSL